MRTHHPSLPVTSLLVRFTSLKAFQSKQKELQALDFRQPLIEISARPIYPLIAPKSKSLQHVLDLARVRGGRGACPGTGDGVPPPAPRLLPSAPGSCVALGLEVVGKVFRGGEKCYGK